MNSLADIWKQVLDMLGTKLTSVAISTWFSDCEAIDLLDEKLIIYTPSDFKKEIIETRFIENLRDALYEIFACDFDVVILGANEIEAYKSSSKKEESLMDSEEFTFERFVVGNSNKFAHAAAMAVAEEQTKKYNPLFIYGESGLGKTHLLYAIRHVVKKNHPEYNIIYVKGDDFTNELIRAIQTGKTPEFREKYRKADLFLMDDIQFIAGKTSTQEEFFHTFNALYESNHQIAFTSDRPPNEIMRLTDRLKTRFESGLITEILPPDYETRMAIIKNKATQLGLILQDNIMDYIAEHLTSNVRQIEGAVKKLKAYRDLMNVDINLETAIKVIKDMFKDKTEYIPTPEIIIEETSKYYSLTPEELKGQNRTKNVVLSRQISMYLIKKLTNLSLQEIGAVFGGRDHSTVIHSIEKIEDNIEKSQDFAQTIKDITSNINSRS